VVYNRDMHFHIISLFPRTVELYTSESILGRAINSGKLKVSVYNPMDFAEESKKGKLPRRVDDKPYAGGPGMVLRAEPIIRAVEEAIGRKRNVGFIHFAPRAEKFTTDIAKQIAGESQLKKRAIKDVVIICGRYEGVDSRINEIFRGRELSIGDYVLTGGELPAMVVIDSVARQLSGVLGDSDSREEERIAAGKYYTRPETVQYKGKKYEVPKVLVEGNHKKIEEWRKNNS